LTGGQEGSGFAGEQEGNNSLRGYGIGAG